MPHPPLLSPNQISDHEGDQRARLLLVDDDASIRDAVSEYLGTHGYVVGTAENVPVMQKLLTDSPWDLIILDLMMPGEDGLSACRRLSDRCPPILILSAMSDVIDRVAGLEAGACDYLPKPFEPRELLARIRALLRLQARFETTPIDGDAAPATSHIGFGQWTLYPEEHRLLDPEGDPVVLTVNEIQLLQVLAERPGRVLSRDMLLDLTRGDTADSFDRSIDLAISRLRAKLGRDGVKFIETVRGLGYRFRADDKRT